MVRMYIAFFAVLLFGGVGLYWAYVRAAKRSRNPTSRRSIVDYLLVWPLILEGNGAGQNDEQRRHTRIRIAIGWIALALLITLAVTFGW